MDRVSTPIVDLDPSIIRPFTALGQPAPAQPSRFQAVRNLGRRLSWKVHWIEGKKVARASAVIADPAASDDALRSAFLRVSVALEAEIANNMRLAAEISVLQRQVADSRAADGSSMPSRPLMQAIYRLTGGLVTPNDFVGLDDLPAIPLTPESEAA